MAPARAGDSAVGDTDGDDAGELAGEFGHVALVPVPAVVIDNSGYIPRHVENSARILSPNVSHYLFISSVSVYADFNRANDDGFLSAQGGGIGTGLASAARRSALPEQK